MRRITGPEVFYVFSWEGCLVPNLEEASWEPQAVTFHFLGEEFSLRGPNKFYRARGLFSQACPHIPRVAITISLCFSGFFQLPASDIPWAARLQEKVILLC